MDWARAVSDTVAPLCMAAALGGLIGWDRESSDKPAGLRTHMIVALGAAAFTTCGLYISGWYSGLGQIDAIRIDPLRVIEGVATGIGFLGAGSIMRSREGVEGLTTAAGIWTTGAVGAACGAQLYLASVTVTILCLLILRPLRVLKVKSDN